MTLTRRRIGIQTTKIIKEKESHKIAHSSYSRSRAMLVRLHYTTKCTEIIAVTHHTIKVVTEFFVTIIMIELIGVYFLFPLYSLSSINHQQMCCFFFFFLPSLHFIDSDSICCTNIFLSNFNMRSRCECRARLQIGSCLPAVIIFLKALMVHA